MGGDVGVDEGGVKGGSIGDRGGDGSIPPKELEVSMGNERGTVENCLKLGVRR